MIFGCRACRRSSRGTRWRPQSRSGAIPWIRPHATYQYHTISYHIKTYEQRRRMHTNQPPHPKKSISSLLRRGSIKGESSDVCVYAHVARAGGEGPGGTRTRIRGKATRAARLSETDGPEMRSAAHTLQGPPEAAAHQTCQCTLSDAHRYCVACAHST